MHYAISASTCAQAWVKGVEYLVGQPGKSAYNVILDVEAPHVITPTDRRAIELLDNLLAQYKQYSIATVAGTIFPQGLYSRFGKKGVFDLYPNVVYPKIKGSSWGRYAYRIVRKHDSKGNLINPLERMVTKLKKQLVSDRTFRAVYELPLADEFEIATYDPENDADRLLPHPCLSHLSFKLTDDNTRIHLTALYRSQYFLQKALGNLVGLAQLQHFVAKEAGILPGGMVCIATLATLDTAGVGGIDVAKALLDGCLKTYSLGSGVQQHVELA